MWLTSDRVSQTSTAVASILYQLAIHQDKQEKLHRELQQVLPQGDEPVTHQHLEQLPYLKACIKETLR